MSGILPPIPDQGGPPEAWGPDAGDAGPDTAPGPASQETFRVPEPTPEPEPVAEAIPPPDPDPDPEPEPVAEVIPPFIAPDPEPSAEVTPPEAPEPVAEVIPPFIAPEREPVAEVTPPEPDPEPVWGQASEPAAVELPEPVAEPPAIEPDREPARAWKPLPEPVPGEHAPLPVVEPAAAPEVSIPQPEPAASHEPASAATSAGSIPSWRAAGSELAAKAGSRPELLVGAACAGGLAIAILIRRIAR